MDVSAQSNVEAPPAPRDPLPRMVDSVGLLQGARELLIRHGDATYRLRITASKKLILTK